MVKDTLAKLTFPNSPSIHRSRLTIDRPYQAASAASFWAFSIAISIEPTM